MLLAFGRRNCHEVRILAKIKPEKCTLRKLVKHFVSSRLRCGHLTDEDAAQMLQRQSVITFGRDHHFHLDDEWRKSWFN